MRRNRLFFIIIGFTCFIASCKKESFITSNNALLFTSADTLHFDTIFTGTGSITQSFKIYNSNDQKLLISQVELAGGNTSFFKLNVDGASGTEFNNIEIAPNDSIYIFVAAKINPNAANLPFLVEDSIRISYNGKKTFVQLDAYGQNARFLRNASVTKDTLWTGELPFVILGQFIVNEAKTLTITQGVQVYCHADTKFIVIGSLHISGENYGKVIFSGDRLDDYYKDLPGSWQGIIFSQSSKNNMVSYTEIKNAHRAITVNDPAADNNRKLKLFQCIIDNALDAGILSSNSSIEAINCLIYNCGNNIKITAGGNYDFTHCTVAGYSTNFIEPINPVLSISNADSNNQIFALTANFVNSIFYGDNGIVNNEIDVQQSGNNSFIVNFENVLYKASDPIAANFINCIQNADPLFVSIDVSKNKYDFHLQAGSPCINAGKNIFVLADLDGNLRDAEPDIGCYELQ
jgi:hypothetical protein